MPFVHESALVSGMRAAERLVEAERGGAPGQVRAVARARAGALL
jgi:hypothetical protein